MQTKELKIKRKFKGIAHLFDKHKNQRDFYDFLLERGFDGIKTYDLLWWITSGVRPPRDTKFYFLASEFTGEKLEEVVKCYSTQI